MNTRNAFITMVAVLFLATINPTTVLADNTLNIIMPDASTGNVYEVISQKYEYSLLYDRSEILAKAFQIPGELDFVSDIREEDRLMAVLFGEERWVYSYSFVSGHEMFFDSSRFLMEDPNDDLPLIEEEDAVAIALDFYEEMYTDSTRAAIEQVDFSRVWDYSQITPDDAERIIVQSSDESVVKLRRSIDGIPIYGPGGYFRIHVANDGDVIGAFDRTRKFDPNPVDKVVLPTYEEIKEIAEIKMDYYCEETKKCQVYAKVGYYETNRGVQQYYLEPVIYFEILKDTISGESYGISFQVPIRDIAVADIINPDPELGI